MASTAALPARRAAEGEQTARIRARLVRPMPADGIWGWLLPLAITAVAGLLRFWRITRPPGAHLTPSSGGLIFDETYYAHDSWSLLHHGVELGSGDSGPGYVVHPPLGKWMIALGELVDHGKEVVVGGNHYPESVLSYRLSAAIIGTLSVLLIARIARRLFRSTLLGCVAGLLLTFEGLEFVQSRVSMLDIFLMFWVLAAFGCLVVDRDWGRRRLAALLDKPLGPGGRGPSLGFRPWRWACGFCLGAATATKWDGLFWIPVFFMLMAVWDLGARRTAGARWPLDDAILRDWLPAIVPFVVLAAAVYTASWTGWFLSDGAHAWHHDTYLDGQAWWGMKWLPHDWEVFRGWLKYHQDIYNFHQGLDSAHPYLSRPWGWLFLSRPVAYFYASPKTCGADSCAQEVLGVGTPAIWWVTIPALIAVGWRMLGRFDWRAAAILMAFLAGYLPWFLADHEHRTMFLFYMLPVVPFMVLAVTMGVGMVIGPRRASPTRRTVGGIVAGAYLVAVIANFAWLYPVLSGKVITYDQWQQRMEPVNWTCGQAPHRNEHHELAGCWI